MAYPITEQTTDSAASDSDAPAAGGRQGTIHDYVDELMLRIADCPYASTPQLFQNVTLGGPCLPREDVLHLVGSRLVSRRTCRRMNLIRSAALRGARGAIPADLRRWVEWGRPEMDPPYRDFMNCWRPRLASEQMSWHDIPGMGGGNTRYLSQQDTDEYFHESPNENWPSDADVDMEGGERSQPPSSQTRWVLNSSTIKAAAAAAVWMRVSQIKYHTYMNEGGNILPSYCSGHCHASAEDPQEMGNFAARGAPGRKPW